MYSYLFRVCKYTQAAGLNIGCPISGPVPHDRQKKQSECKRIETSCALIFDFAHVSTSLKGITTW